MKPETFEFYAAQRLEGIKPRQMEAVLALKSEGATVPFIARYRKDKTGNLDEVQVRAVIEAKETFDEVVKRKAFILGELTEQKNLTPEIQKRLEATWELDELEEIYRPYKKKKKTKATLAREAGLQELADWLWAVGHGERPEEPTMEVKAKLYISIEKGFASYDLVLKGALDILIEKLANDTELRGFVKDHMWKLGKVVSKAAKGFKKHSKYSSYGDFSEPVKSLFEDKNTHRYLAMRRGWNEEELTVTIEGDQAMLLKKFETTITTTPDTSLGVYLKTGAKAALEVYVLPSVVNEIHRELKDKAEGHAIQVFAENVRRLLLASPFGPKVVLGIDPGIRTGCKVALVEKGGNYVSHTVMQTQGDQAFENAKKLFGEVLNKIKIEAVAVGNGTHGRETQAFIRKVLKDLGHGELPVVLVNETGASVYSASDVARDEFPDLDLTIRGAISIARRLQDPLSELVKVDPKSLGVGQYQHDVAPAKLKKSLDAVVESSVNAVGVDLNTASKYLLAYVSGIGPAIAESIVEYRKKQLFKDRQELLQVAKVSTKVFEQASGFLRIFKGMSVLDSTGIHPERYAAIRDMASELGVQVADLIGDGARKLLDVREKYLPILGEHTFFDIIKELEKPGRDPRDPFKVQQFREDIFEIKDLQENMICPGIVSNVTSFGAFVDIGVHQDGLVHVSELSEKFVTDPHQVVKPGDFVTVRVMKVDLDKNQISLSMKLNPESSRPAGRPPQRAGERQAGERQAGERQGPRSGPPRGPRPGSGPRPSGREGADRSARGGGQNPGGGRPRQESARPPKPAFNNAFAGLANLVQKPDSTPAARTSSAKKS